MVNDDKAIALMTLVLKAGPLQFFIIYIGSGLAIAFGIGLFTHIPSLDRYAMIRYAILAISCLAAVAGPVEANYNRLEISDRAITFRSISKRWSVPLCDIKDWKIKGGNGSLLSLHLFTYDGREWCVLGLSRLGVRDEVIVQKAIAKCLRNYRRGK